MRKISLFLFIIILLGCGSTTSYQPPEEETEINGFSSNETLEVMTWNLEHFAKNGSITVDYVAEILDSLDVDIIALQEIESSAKFNQLNEALVDWEGYRSTGAAYDINLAFLYRTDLQPQFYQILTSEWYYLPRSPLVMEVNFQGENLVIINNHLKALSGSENEERRRGGCERLDAYIETHFSNDKVILVGDLNDQLTDEAESNVFSVFLDDPENYLFTDLEIELSGHENFSYPSYPSHLDHILISNELFADYEHEKSDVQTMQVDDFFSNWNQYDENVSDHLPVAIKLFFE